MIISAAEHTKPTPYRSASRARPTRFVRSNDAEQRSELHTSSGGEEWSPQSSGTTGTLYSAYFFDAQRGFVVGPSNHILQTSDGGATWDRVQPGISGSLYDITFADAINGWAVGQGGIMLRTIDGGMSWTSDPSPTTNTLFGVAFENKDRGWIVGAYGTILAYAGDLGTTAESTPAQPMGISLGPNYPNPFNPRTTINFTLQEPGRVTVQVFDVLGRMIETLVDESRTAGDHAVTWTAVDAPSGVYFYRLSTATGHVESTMTLIASKKKPTGCSTGSTVKRWFVAFTRPVGRKAIARRRRFASVKRLSAGCDWAQTCRRASHSGKDRGIEHTICGITLVPVERRTRPLQPGYRSRRACSQRHRYAIPSSSARSSSCDLHAGDRAADCVIFR